MLPNDEYISDFNAAVGDITDQLGEHRLRIYRQIESHVIAAYQVIQRIHGHIIAEITKSIPKEL